MGYDFQVLSAVERSLLACAVTVQVTPVVAIAPLIIIPVKDARLALVALFPVVSNTTLGLRTVDPGRAGATGG